MTWVRISSWPQLFASAFVLAFCVCVIWSGGPQIAGAAQTVRLGECGGYERLKVRPPSFSLVCNNTTFTRISWSRWGLTVANGRGRVHLNCGSGSKCPVPAAMLRASGRRTCFNPDTKRRTRIYTVVRANWRFRSAPKQLIHRIPCLSGDTELYAARRALIRARFVCDRPYGTQAGVQDGSVRGTGCSAFGFRVGVLEFPTAAARISAQNAEIRSYQSSFDPGPKDCEFVLVARGRLLAYNSDPNVPEIGVTYQNTAAGMRRVAAVFRVVPIVVPTACGS